MYLSDLHTALEGRLLLLLLPHLGPISSSTTFVSERRVPIRYPGTHDKWPGRDRQRDRQICNRRAPTTTLPQLGTVPLRPNR